MLFSMLFKILTQPKTMFFTKKTQYGTGKRQNLRSCFCLWEFFFFLFPCLFLDIFCFQAQLNIFCSPAKDFSTARLSNGKLCSNSQIIIVKWKWSLPQMINSEKEKERSYFDSQASKILVFTKQCLSVETWISNGVGATNIQAKHFFPGGEGECPSLISPPPSFMHIFCA